MEVKMMNQAKSADRPAKVEFSSWDPYVNRKYRSKSIVKLTPVIKNGVNSLWI